MTGHQSDRDDPAESMSGDDAVRPDGGFDPAFFRDVVGQVGAGVAVYDDSGHFTYVNDAYADLLGRDSDALLDTPIWEVNPSVDRDRFDDYWASFSIGETRRRETVHRRADDTEVPVETVTTAIERDGERYNVGTIVDVSERVEGMRRLERQNERLQEFASVVSHDLRNPLNVAVGRIELARADCDSEHLDAIDRSLRRMEDLIEGVVTLVRQGGVVDDPEILALSVAVESAWAATSNTEATLLTDDDLETVRSDEERLTRLFQNLFENAIEYAGPDCTVRVGRLPDGFYVADDGPGVPEDVAADVFEYGFSTETDNAGFGLAIVEEIATAHDWTVDLVESEDGGARFEVRGVEFE